MTETETVPRQSGTADAASWTAHEPGAERRAERKAPAVPGWPDVPRPAVTGPPGTEPSGPEPRLPRELVLRALI